MKSIHSLVLSTLLTVALGGCATPFRAPADAAHIQLERGDSPVVRVEKIWLEEKAGSLAVTGYVIKRLGVDDTTATHLDVTLFDATGRVIRTTEEHFEPRQINSSVRRHRDGRYWVKIDPTPATIARIEVRAHEGTHPHS